VLTGAASGAGTIRLPDWLAPWVPPEIAQSAGQLLAGLGPVVDSLLQAAPALAGGVTVATWVVWGIGSVLLVMLGASAAYELHYPHTERILREPCVQGQGARLPRAAAADDRQLPGISSRRRPVRPARWA